MSSSSSEESDTDSASSGLISLPGSGHSGAAILAPLVVLGASTLDTPQQVLRPGGSPPPPAKEEAYKSTSSTMQISDDTSEHGLDCSVKTLYEGPEKCHCCTNWVEEYPQDIREFVDDAEDTKSKAIVARMKKNHNQDGRPLILDPIVIQNAPLKGFLTTLFRDYEGITPQLKKLVLKAPFHAFYHSWDSFKRLMNQLSGEDKKYVSLLFNLLQPEIEPIIEEVSDMVANNVISYNLLWALFPPGQYLYSEAHSQGYIYVCDSCHPLGMGFPVGARYVDWDGKQFGYATKRINVSPFVGTKQISKLEVYPLHLHESPEAVKAHALRRGARFRSLCSSVRHMAYAGNALCEGNHHVSGQNVQVSLATKLPPLSPGRIDPSLTHARAYKLDERVMLDTALSPDGPSCLASLQEGFDKPKMDLVDRTHIGPPTSGQHYRPNHPPPTAMPRYVTMMNMPGPQSVRAARQWPGPTVNLHATAGQAPEADLSLTDDELMLCSSVLTAWCLTTKRWVSLLEIDNIRTISWNKEALAQVVLPVSHKELMLSFVEAHISGDVKFDDIIKGKGLGLLMLLVGDPGLGKTLTAEALAEKVQRPLYILTASELGHDPQSIETALVKFLSMTAKWNAILLLDECDVFLEERSSSKIKHSAIVAVFLR